MTSPDPWNIMPAEPEDAYAPADVDYWKRRALRAERKLERLQSRAARWDINGQPGPYVPQDGWM